MGLFQTPPQSEADAARDRPLALAPEQVQGLTEAEWYAQAYRGDSVQLTWRAVLMGGGLGFLLSFTNLYIGLKTGWFLGVSITACILSYAIWGSLLRAGVARSPMTILESACMASTASSAGYATGNILISAVPAMLLLSVSEQNPQGTQLRWYVLGPWLFCLGAMGVIMAIPMKRNMINRERLRFPAGMAGAVTLQSLYSEGAEAMAKARALGLAALFGMAVPVLKDLNLFTRINARGAVERHALLPAQSNVLDVGLTIPARVYDPKAHQWIEQVFKPSDWQMRLDHSVVLLAAGGIVGLRTAASMALGALALAVVIGPVALGWGWVAPDGQLVTAALKPGTAWKEIGIWCGAPLMVAHGLTSFATEWRTVVRAFSGLGGAGAAASEAGGEAPAPAVDPAGIEVPARWFVRGMTVSAAATVALAWAAFGIPPRLGVLAVVMTFFLSLVACRATGETSITPTGPLGKIMQLAFGVLMPQSVSANLMTASISAGAGLASADLLKDLKTGYLLGANPRRQFIAQLAGLFAGVPASMLGYFLLIPDARAMMGEGDRPPVFPAPSAQQWKAVAELFKVGLSNLHPMARQAIVIGTLVGVVLALAEWASPRARRLLPSATGLGLGMLLPFFSSFSMLLGALLAWGLQRASPARAERLVVPISSGLIAGESILGVVVAALNNFVLR